MRRGRVATLAIAVCTFAALLVSALAPVAVSAQDGLSTAAAALHEAASAGCVELAEGPLAVRVATELPDDAPNPFGLTDAVLAPTLSALENDARFEAVHIAGFGRDGVHPATVAHRLGYTSLLDLVLRLEGGDLVIEGTAWSTADETERGSFTRRTDLDISLRRFTGFPPALADDTVQARSVRLPGRGYIALAVADLDADGRPEIVAVRPGEAHVVRLDGRRVHLVGRAGFPEDIPRAASPRRRTLASALPAGDRVLLRISDHAVGLALRLEGGAPSVSVVDGPCSADRYPLMGGCAALVAGRDFFDEALTRSASPYPEAPAHFYAYAFGSYETREGEATSYEAVVTPTGRLALRVRWERPGDSDAPEIQERSAGAVGYGTALAMADLDIDGAAELLVSHAAPAGGGDQLSLLRALPRGALRVMWRGDALGGSIWVAAAGDVDGDGNEELLAIEEPSAGRGRAALWIVR